MLQRNANESTSYWLQLLVSIGIASLGLVVGSTAVIIGAMLVAPLMGPIIGLAMGLATGSPFLVLRAGSRIVLSVAVAIGGAALITVLLPFHELNSEIAARTFPTVLDLLTAGFCALAGVYAALRPGSDTATTAAGTSIGISLVPPLCASGYGFGTLAWPVAGGAALLFLTNLVAIIFVGMVSFVAAGFNRVEVTSLERAELARDQGAIVTAAIARRLAGLFESKAGPLLRFLMPLLLLAAVYVPLRRALDEVAWQVRARAAVQAAMDREPYKIVENRVRVERHEVDLLVVLLGKASDADAVHTRLKTAIEQASGVVPRIEVLAVPDAAAFAGLESSLRTTNSPLPLAPPKPPPLTEQLTIAHASLRKSIARVWPTQSAGELLAVSVAALEGVPIRLRVAHLGEALSADGLESLRRSVSSDVEHDIEIKDVAIPSAISRSEDDLDFILHVATAIDAALEFPALNVCVTEPEMPKSRRRWPAEEQRLTEMLRSVVAKHPRVFTATGGTWSVQIKRRECAEASPPVSAGAENGTPSVGSSARP
jgi:uncharacterized hydrophobic protein (TIGR00271 family)